MVKVKDCILVFECYCGGKHSKRMALAAKKWFGALVGISFGGYRQSFALHTGLKYRGRVPLDQLKVYIDQFLVHARFHSGLTFLVTRIGTDIAGYTDKEMSPLFKESPPNCILPKCWGIDNGSPSHEVYQIFKGDLEKVILPE